MIRMDNVHDKIIAARLRLLFREPFFGNLATRLTLVELTDTDSWCKTAATDGRRLYYNTNFFEKLSIDNIVFVLAHEVLHIVFDHIERFRNYSHRTYADIKRINAACDYVVNECLIKNKIGTEIPNFNSYHDKKYYGMNAEQIYILLNEKIINKYSLIDSHIDWGENTDDSKPVLSEQEIQEIKTECIEAIIQAAGIAKNSGQGSLPAEIERIVCSLNKPIINWRQLIRQHIKSLYKNNYSFNRPNRRFHHLKCIVPSLQCAETIDVCISIDASGSITPEMVKDFLSEIKGIMEEFLDFKIKLWSFDTKVYNVQDFDQYNIDTFEEYKVIGGGGTTLNCNWEYMKENDIVPKKFIVFTDMEIYDNNYGDPNYTDTLFIAHDTNMIAPHGVTVKYEI